MVIGSTAIKHYFTDFPREPKDLDIAVYSKDGLKNKMGVEYLENPVILKYQDEGFLKPDLMLSLKISHMFWKTNWEKHMFDIQFLLKKGCKYNLSLVQELRSLWENVLPKIKRSKLGQSKEDFFDNAVNENTNQHDYWHTLLTEIPAYTKILKENCEVELDFNKWENLSFEEKCDVVFEETAVMATERFKNTDYRLAYKRQLKQNIIKHFPEPIALFAIENYIQLEKPKFNFIEIINSKLA